MVSGEWWVTRRESAHLVSLPLLWFVCLVCKQKTGRSERLVHCVGQRTFFEWPQCTLKHGAGFACLCTRVRHILMFPVAVGSRTENQLSLVIDALHRHVSLDGESTAIDNCEATTVFLSRFPASVESIVSGQNSLFTFAAQK